MYVPRLADFLSRRLRLLIFMVKFHGRHIMIFTGIILSSSYFIYMLLNKNVRLNDRNCRDLDIYATVLDVCFAHHTACNG